MAEKKESFFWTSYADLMTSLFFIMLTLFILVIVLLHKHIENTTKILVATQEQLKAIEEVQKSTEELDTSDYYEYKAEYKKYVLNVRCSFDQLKFSLADLKTDRVALQKAGEEIQGFLERNKDNQYMLIIEGQASRNSEAWTDRNYELSFMRGLTLMKYWKDVCQIDFGYNCEIQIAGSGDGRYNFGYTGGEETESFRQHNQQLMRERGENEWMNQRFIIHILPKNIMEKTDEK